MDQRMHPTNVPLIQERLSCRFEEHHCLRFSEPLVAPPCRSGLDGEDVFNAWLPQNMQFTRQTVSNLATSHKRLSLMPAFITGWFTHF